MGRLLGVDVSVWQGDIDWRRVKASGVDFAVIRATVGMNTDRMLEKNIEGVTKNKIPYGLYHASYASDIGEAVEEALHFKKTIEYYEPSYPCVYDIEEFTENAGCGKFNAAAETSTFLHIIEKTFYASFYTNPYFLQKNNMEGLLSVFDFWCAHWGVQKPKYKCGIHQFTNKGTVDGIKGYVDLNVAFKNYPKIIANMKGGENK